MRKRLPIFLNEGLKPRVPINNGSQSTSDATSVNNANGIVNVPKKEDVLSNGTYGLSRDELDVMRDIGSIIDLQKDTIDMVESVFGDDIKYVRTRGDYIQSNTYFIDDTNRLWIHKDFKPAIGNFGTNSNNYYEWQADLKKLIELSKKTDIFQIDGDVEISNLSITSFPKGFPKQICGDFIIKSLPNLLSSRNLPRVVYKKGGYPWIQIENLGHIREKEMDEYRQMIVNRDNKPVTIEGLYQIEKQNNEDNMNSQCSESEVLRRISIGERFLNEAFPGALNKLFKAIPPYLSKEPNKDDYKDEEEYKKAHDEWAKEHDIWVPKNDAYHQMLSIISKNRKIWHETIVPLIDADWGNIKDSDIKAYYRYGDIHNDLSKDNNKSEFKGVKIFTDDTKTISLVYARLNSKEAKIVCFYDDNEGEWITDYSEIAGIIRERDAIYKDIQNRIVPLGIKPNDFPEPSDNNVTVKEMIYHQLWWCLCMANGTYEGKKNKKQFKFENLIYNEYLNADDKIDEDFVHCVLTDIFGTYLQQRNKRNMYDVGGVLNTNPVTQKQIMTDGESINLGDAGSNGAKNARSFYKDVQTYVQRKAIDDINPAMYFSDEYMRVILSALSVNSGGDPRVKLDKDEIDSADRDQLLEMIETASDVNIFNTALKYLTYSFDINGKGDNASVSNVDDDLNPSKVMMLFPDKIKSEYIIKTDINKSAFDRDYKRYIRPINRIGMKGEINTAEYNPFTQERTPKTIRGDFEELYNDKFHNSFVDENEEELLKNLDRIYKRYNTQSYIRFIDNAVDNIVNSSVDASKQSAKKKKDVKNNIRTMMHQIMQYPSFTINNIMNNYLDSEKKDVAMHPTKNDLGDFTILNRDDVFNIRGEKEVPLSVLSQSIRNLNDYSLNMNVDKDKLAKLNLLYDQFDHFVLIAKRNSSEKVTLGGNKIPFNTMTLSDRQDVLREMKFEIVQTYKGVFKNNEKTNTLDSIFRKDRLSTKNKKPVIQETPHMDSMDEARRYFTLLTKHSRKIDTYGKEVMPIINGVDADAFRDDFFTVFNSRIQMVQKVKLGLEIIKNYINNVVWLFENCYENDILLQKINPIMRTADKFLNEIENILKNIRDLEDDGHYGDKDAYFSSIINYGQDFIYALISEKNYIGNVEKKRTEIEKDIKTSNAG